MGECAVCCEALNNSYRSKVTCTQCLYTTCASCVSTYLCDTPEYAHCMNCKKGWDRGFLSQFISKSFVKGKYKTAREKHLLDREMSLMPSTQSDVERILNRKKQDREIYDLHKEITKLRAERSKWWPIDVVTKELTNTLEIEIFTLQKKVELCKFKIDAGPVEKKTFIRKCGGEECRGFLSTQWKCGLCDKHTCKECLEVKLGDNHLCNPDSVATAKLLFSDSKPCPGCGVVIFKIVGCDQMYCVMCNTAFSWRSGSIVTGRIHNPHYFEYLRNKNVTVREIGDVPCGGLPTRQSIIPPPALLYTDVWGAYMLCLHIQDVTMPTLAPRDTKQYRIDYLMKILSENELKASLQRVEKANSKRIEYRLIYSMFCDVTIDLFRNVTQASQYEQLVVEMRNLVKYANDQFVRIADAFDCKPPHIYAQGWSLYPPRAF